METQHVEWQVGTTPGLRPPGVPSHGAARLLLLTATGTGWALSLPLSELSPRLPTEDSPRGRVSRHYLPAPARLERRDHRALLSSFPARILLPALQGGRTKPPE